MLSGRLPETENKRICQMSGLKSDRSPLRNFEWWLPTRELLKQYLTEKQNGRLRKVVAMRELTVFIISLRLIGSVGKKIS